MSRSKPRGTRLWFVSLVAIALVVPTSVASGQQPGKAGELCPVPNAAGTAAGDPIKPAITLQADPQSSAKVVNFGADREPESVAFRINVPSVLPKDVEKRLELVADPIVRTGETTESVSFPDPRYSALRVSGNRKRISFRVCFDPPKDLPAGKYTGQVVLEGPPGVDSADVTVTLNAKDGLGFWIGMVATGLLAFLVLLYKGASDERATRMAAAEKLPDTLDDGTPNQAKTKAKTDATRWLSAAWACIWNPGWAFPTLFAVGAAFGVLFAAYANNPSWGESGFLSSVAALIGTGLAAVGARAILTPSGK